MSLLEIIEDIDEVIMDYNGTLASSGTIIPGVKELINEISPLYNLTVLTADTFGTAISNLANLNLNVQIVKSGKDKKHFVKTLKKQKRTVLVLGNGKNDIEMFKEADISIAIIGPDGAYSKLLEQSTIVVTNIFYALELLKDTKRITATLRE